MNVLVMVMAVGVVEVGVVNTRYGVRQQGADTWVVEMCVFTHAHVHDNIPYRRLLKYTDRRIPTHNKPSAGMPDPERPAHGMAGSGDGYPFNTDLDWGLSGL